MKFITLINFILKKYMTKKHQIMKIIVFYIFTMILLSTYWKILWLDDFLQVGCQKKSLLIQIWWMIQVSINFSL